MPVLAIFKALVVFELILIVAFFFVILLICIQIWSRVGIFHPFTPQETRRLAEGLWLTEVLKVLLYACWWWLFGLQFVYRGLIKRKGNSKSRPPSSPA